LSITEVDTDGLVHARTHFDVDDFDAAIAELDARYLAGEAAACAQTWSGFAIAFAGFNRRELKLAPGWVNIDHRRGAAFAPGDMAAYIHDLWNDSPDVNMYVEVVHRLSNLGVVITQAAHGTSQHGFRGRMAGSSIFTFDDDLVSRCELFDEADLEAAIAKFDQLASRRGDWRRGVARIRKRMVAFCGPGLGCLGRNRGRQLFGHRPPRVVMPRINMGEMRWSKICKPPPTSASRYRW